MANVIDGDGHVLEPPEELTEFLSPEFRRMSSRRPQLFPPADHFHGQPLLKVTGTAERETRPGPKEWVEFLEELNISATVLYPSRGVCLAKIRNADWAIGVCQAYNDWLAECYLKVDPRFQGMALIPIQDPDAAIDELRRAVTILGMRGAVIPSNGLPVHLGSRQYWPLYAEAERLGCAVALHGGCHDGLGFDDMNVYAGVNALGHPFGQMISFAAMSLNGVFDKFPGVRFAFLEAGVSWLLTIIERLDGACESHVQADPRGELARLAEGESFKDYLLRQVAEGRIYVGIAGDEADLPHAISTLGSNPFMYSSDFPHEVTLESCREKIQDIRNNKELQASDRSSILALNAVKLYGL